MTDKSEFTWIQLNKEKNYLHIVYSDYRHGNRRGSSRFGDNVARHMGVALTNDSNRPTDHRSYKWVDLNFGREVSSIFYKFSSFHNGFDNHNNKDSLSDDPYLGVGARYMGIMLGSKESTKASDYKWIKIREKNKFEHIIFDAPLNNSLILNKGLGSNYNTVDGYKNNHCLDFKRDSKMYANIGNIRPMPLNNNVPVFYKSGILLHSEVENQMSSVNHDLKNRMTLENFEYIGEDNVTPFDDPTLPKPIMLKEKEGENNEKVFRSFTPQIAIEHDDIGTINEFDNPDYLNYSFFIRSTYKKPRTLIMRGYGIDYLKANLTRDGAKVERVKDEYERTVSDTSCPDTAVEQFGEYTRFQFRTKCFSGWPFFKIAFGLEKYSLDDDDKDGYISVFGFQVTRSSIHMPYIHSNIPIPKTELTYPLYSFVKPQNRFKIEFDLYCAHINKNKMIKLISFEGEQHKSENDFYIALKGRDIIFVYKDGADALNESDGVIYPDVRPLELTAKDTFGKINVRAEYSDIGSYSEIGRNPYYGQGRTRLYINNVLRDECKNHSYKFTKYTKMKIGVFDDISKDAHKKSMGFTISNLKISE